MNNKIEMSLGLFFTLLVTAYSQIIFASSKISSACEWGTAAKSGQAAFFQHAKYKGTCVIRLVGRYSNSKAIGIGNDKISSIKIGPGTQVKLCKDSNFRGGCKIYTKSMASLGKMNDKTSSAAISLKAKTNKKASANCRPKANQVAFFQHAKYKGTCVVRKVGRYANAKSIGIGNDKISSVILGSGTHVVLCKDSNFKGGCKTYTKSMTRIGKMNDKTSSAIIVKTVPKKAPPYVYEKNETPPIKTSPSKSDGKFDLLAPSELNVDSVTSTTVTLSWFDNSDREYGVEVYRMDPVEAKRNQDTTWEFIALFQERMMDKIKETGWRSDEDYDLSPNTNYCYRLRAYVGFDRSEVSDYSKIVCTITKVSDE